MARLKSLNETTKGAWHEYGGWIILCCLAFLLYSFRKLFTTLGGGAGDLAEAALAKARAEAEAKIAAAQAEADKKKAVVKVQVATGTSTKYTDSQIAQFETDARSLAGMLGQLNFGMATVFKDKGGAFTMLKQKYSRLRLMNNKPFIWTGGKEGDKTRPYKNVTTETASCVKNAVNYKALIPFYKDVTDGRDLVADFRYFVTGTEYTQYFKWIL